MQSMGRSNSESSNPVSAVTTSFRARARKRTAHACDACRMRKSRCDGQQPCAWCTENDVDCLYGRQQQLAVGQGASQGKSDKILETVLRMDALLNSIHENLRSPHSAVSDRSYSPGRLISEPTPSDRDFDRVANASLPSHVSATEDLLSSTLAQPFPSLIEQFRPIFLLESRRPPLPFQSRFTRSPVFTPNEANRLIASFQSTLNFWYPVISKANLDVLFDRIQNGFSNNSCEDCLALLVLALGAASELVKYTNSDETYRSFDSRQQQSELSNMASVCFDEASKLLAVAYMEVSTTSAQCVFLSALFCSFLQRPLQTWSHLSMTATKCRSLIAYATGSISFEEEECVRRMFWSCYIIESDLISELSHLPQSGVAEVESQTPLPGPLITHSTSTLTESSALYFLSCISIRRLLNRVHHLLYAEDKHKSPTHTINDSLHNMIAELDHQLVLWRDTLPEFLQFEEGERECRNEHAAFLRQRYLACKSVIFRPYVEVVLKHIDIGHPPEIIENATRCLSASCYHIVYLRSFSQTVLIDPWICSLSMTSTMFILLASLSNPSLRQTLLAQHNIGEFGTHLQRLISSWSGIVPNKSPSIEQSLRLIGEIDGLIRRRL
ncbi:Zn2/Cys6 DNA-binding protein [Glarea lozoyensis ATCC 20868]|uniref:Zn2/Cys6 DNA-binding protein n=1 Tax=Glarea lozoyensis (strain ATCC 20868 / MF5171) TaxID=1116229 RepID=S3CKX6_GLAL2|nr:Zn2/Cys6 DNA-binding protein [Glarea lozoyensis ATCC 20868]EPE25849.1 Zn2/Cys6 DNA-binding protein [Glarea lozoyensis ATCC 20868]